MVNTLVGLALGLSPILVVTALLTLTTWRDRVHQTTVARQIRLTDAIGAELGAIVAPLVKRRLSGRWRIEMAVPLGHPGTVARVLAIAHRVLPDPYELVLTPQAEPRGRFTPKAPAATRRLRAA
jgi:hypothetical protein